MSDFQIVNENRDSVKLKSIEILMSDFFLTQDLKLCIANVVGQFACGSEMSRKILSSAPDCYECKMF